MELTSKKWHFCIRRRNKHEYEALRKKKHFVLVATAAIEYWKGKKEKKNKPAVYKGKGHIRYK